MAKRASGVCPLGGPEGKGEEKIIRKAWKMRFNQSLVVGSKDHHAQKTGYTTGSIDSSIREEKLDPQDNGKSGKGRVWTRTSTCAIGFETVYGGQQLGERRKDRRKKVGRFPTGKTGQERQSSTWLAATRWKCESYAGKIGEGRVG